MKNHGEGSVPVSSPAPGRQAWRPSWRWHLKILAAIYVFLILFYAVVDRWLSRLPPPYGLREIPQELTPWLKK